MKKISEKLFINIFANVIICLVIVAVFSFSLGGDIFTTASADGEKPIYNGNRGGKSVSLMFNVYQGTEYIDGIIETLESHGANATFFIGGIWAEKTAMPCKRFLTAATNSATTGIFILTRINSALKKTVRKLSCVMNLLNNSQVMK